MWLQTYMRKSALEWYSLLFSWIKVSQRKLSEIVSRLELQNFNLALICDY